MNLLNNVIYAPPHFCGGAYIVPREIFKVKRLQQTAFGGILNKLITLNTEKQTLLFLSSVFFYTDCLAYGKFYAFFGIEIFKTATIITVTYG